MSKSGRVTERAKSFGDKFLKEYSFNHQQITNNAINLHCFFVLCHPQTKFHFIMYLKYVHFLLPSLLHCMFFHVCSILMLSPDWGHSQVFCVPSHSQTQPNTASHSQTQPVTARHSQALAVSVHRIAS